MKRKLALALSLLAFAACGDPQPAGSGQVVLSLTTTDPVDGTIYRLTPGSRLAVSASDNSYYDTFSLDADWPLVSVNVPANDYQATLENGSISGGVWPLQRTLPDGTTDTINAKLVTPMPAAFTVPDNGSYPLVLRFQVAGGTITFAYGTIDTSVEVGVVAATGGSLSGLAGLGPALVQHTPSTPSWIVDALPPYAATGMVVSFSGTLTGGWSQRSSTLVCAPMSGRMSSSGQFNGFDDLVTEAGGPLELCIEGAPGGPSRLRLQAGRTTTGTTETFSDSDAPPKTFSTLLVAQLPVAVFDGGHTLDLSQLDHDFTVGGTFEAAVSSKLDGWSWTASFTATVTFSFVTT
jgi:hypothetical protein